MMTEQRKKRIETKIRESRSRLLDANPFFSLLLMYLKFVAVAGMKKISTNGRCIYFSPEFIDKLYKDELDFILCHQIMHIVCGHIWRPFDLGGDNYHFACDVLINALLTESGFDEERYAHLGYIYREVPGLKADVKSMSVEEIYNELPYSLYAFDEQTRSRFCPDNDSMWDKKDDGGEIGEIIIDLPKIEGIAQEARAESDDGQTLLKRQWQSRIAAANIAHSSGDKSDGVGSVPDFIKRIIKKMRKPTLDWKKILDNFVQEAVCDYSFSPPDRRFADTDFFLPDFNEREFVSKEIFFMVDTSGSVTDEELTAVYSEISGAIEQFNGKLNGKIGFFDTEVKGLTPFESVGDLMRIVPCGDGGTDFRAIFDYIRCHCAENMPACIVVFTDGDGPYPDKSASLGIPVLWLINNSDFTAPFGKTTRVIPKGAVE